MTSRERKRSPRSRFYDGGIYSRLVDPLLTGLRGFTAKHVDAGTRVLDACCGTGSLALALAEKCEHVTGIDISPRNVSFARKSVEHTGHNNVAFEIADAAHLDTYDTDTFDIVTIVLALHEMPTHLRLPVVRELGRVGRKLIAVDYRVPMPWNLAGARNRALEVAAGREHFAGFRDFGRRGGLGPLLAEAGQIIEHRRTVDQGTLELLVSARRL